MSRTWSSKAALLPWLAPGNALNNLMMGGSGNNTSRGGIDV
jgi:hypothetical protein